jgi:hypothetical protein
MGIKSYKHVSATLLKIISTSFLKIKQVSKIRLLGFFL